MNRPARPIAREPSGTRRPRPRVWGPVAGALVLALVPTAATADSVPPATAARFAELARKAEAAFAQAGPGAALPLYEDGLARFGEDYGRIHLRMGQLYQQLGRNAEAAFAFKRCDADLRVDALDRELICQDGLKAVSAPVTLLAAPPGARVLVVEPVAFAGPLASGDRLPLGTARLLVEAPQHDRKETTIRVVPEGVQWTVELGASYTDEANAEPQPGDPGPGPRRWPAYVVAGTGLALVGAGVLLGYLNRDALAGIRHDQEKGACGDDHCQSDLDAAETRGTLADGLWIGGAGVTAAGVGLWALTL